MYMTLTLHCSCVGQFVFDIDITTATAYMYVHVLVVAMFAKSIIGCVSGDIQLHNAESHLHIDDKLLIYV